MKVKIRLDGIDFDVEVADGVASAFQSALAKEEKSRADSAEAVKKAEQAKDEAQGALKAATEKLMSETKRADSLASEDEIEKRIEARVSLIDDAKKIAPKLDPKGKTERSIRLDALKEAGFTMTNETDAEVIGAFRFAVSQAGKSNSGYPANFGNKEPAMRREDAADDDGREAMIRANRGEKEEK